METKGRGLGAVLLAGALLVAALLLVSGDEGTDPQTPSGLPGMPPPYLGVAVLGEGELTAAVDAYGNVVDLRAPGPAGRALIENPADRQAAGTVAAGTGIQPWVRVGSGPELPMWRADRIRQRYLPGTNALRTEAWFGGAHVVVTQAVHGGELAIAVGGSASVQLRTSAGRSLLTKDPRVIAAAVAADRRWLARARPLGAGAPAWAEEMYERSLLVLRALTDRRAGAVAAGARDGWAYVWPRDAGAVALAFDAAGCSATARRIARFLLDLDLDVAARFDGNGDPVPGRGPQGDASGWVAVAARAAGLDPPPPLLWRNLPDYWEQGPGDYLANALSAAPADVPEFSRHMWGENSDTPRRGLVREAGDPDSGLDSAAAWAVRPFAIPALFPQARETMLRLAGDGGRFGLLPGEGWEGGEDPWSAPTAWTAWSLAALGERRAALRLIAALRRSATPAGALPERVDAGTGIPRSTTPLAWSHAFALLALRELWPSG